MMAGQDIRVWRPPGLGGVEWHRGLRVTRVVPKHWHEEFQVVLIDGGDGELLYRGAWRPTPNGSVFLMPPGEVHGNRAKGNQGCNYRTLNIHMDLLQEAANQVAGRSAGDPAFRRPVVYQTDLVARLGRTHQRLRDSSTFLERESLLLDALVQLIKRCGERIPGSHVLRRERLAVRRVRDFLVAHYVENVSLGQIARLAGLSPYHLNRVFAAELGLPPHAFQAQQRVVRARVLLRQGRPLAEVAAETGFADQSHLTRIFKRVVGITPGAYQRAC